MFSAKVQGQGPDVCQEEAPEIRERKRGKGPVKGLETDHYCAGSTGGTAGGSVNNRSVSFVSNTHRP